MHPVTAYSAYKCGQDPCASIRMGVHADQSCLSNVDVALEMLDPLHSDLLVVVRRLEM